jgi:hypothetical protein
VIFIHPCWSSSSAPPWTILATVIAAVPFTVAVVGGVVGTRIVVTIEAENRH